MKQHTLYLHIGTHKTGTTSIQFTCDRVRQQLQEQGLVYPRIGKRNPGHHHFAHAIADQGSAEVSPADADEFVRNVRRELKKRDVLLSAEPFYRHTVGYDPASKNLWEAKERYVARLRALFGDEHVVVVAYIRRQDSLALSLYKESVLKAAYSKSLDTFCTERADFLDYRRNVELWARYFGRANVRLFRYDPALRGSAHVSEFLRRLGYGIRLDPSHSETVERNVSLPGSVVELKRRMNLLGFAGRQSLLAREILEAVFSADSLAATAVQSLYQEERASIASLRPFIHENEHLRQYFTNQEDCDLLCAPGLDFVTIYTPKDEHALNIQVNILHAVFAHMFARIGEVAHGCAEELLCGGLSLEAVQRAQQSVDFQPRSRGNHLTLLQALAASGQSDRIAATRKEAGKYLAPVEQEALEAAARSLTSKSGGTRLFQPNLSRWRRLLARYFVALAFILRWES